MSCMLCLLYLGTTAAVMEEAAGVLRFSRRGLDPLLSGDLIVVC